MPFSYHGGPAAVLEDSNPCVEPQEHGKPAQTHSHRWHPLEIRSNRPRSQREENSREFKDELYSSFARPPDDFLCSDTHGTSTYCNSRRTSQASSDRPIAASGSPSRSNFESSETSTIKRHRSTRSGTGFDGPLSSVDDMPPLSPSDALDSPKCSSMRVSRLPGSSRKFNSDVSGSIDWEKSWPKRKPHRVHHVSETSNSDPAHHIHAVDPFSMITQSEGSDDSDLEDSNYPDAAAHDYRFHTIHQYGLKSCPNLHTQLDGFVPSWTAIDGDPSAALSGYSEFDKYRHRYHLHLPHTISRRFRRLGRRLRGSSSSSYSVRSEFPAPPDGKERRFLARNSTDIWPSSGDESPVFNTPESDDTPINTRGSHIDPLAMAGMMIATAGLDRLSTPASQDQRSRVSTPLSSSAASPSPRTSTSTSRSTPANVPPTIPFNTLSSSGPQSGVASPATRPPQRPGQRRRAQRSHLSEVTTPEELTLPVEPVDDNPYYQPTFSPFSIETLQEYSTSSGSGSHESLYPKPLSTSRGSSARVQSPIEDSRPTLRGSTFGADRISPPTRTSSTGKTGDSMYGGDGLDGLENVDKSLQSTTSIGLKPISRSSARSSPLGIIGQHVDEKTGDTISGDNPSRSCHPDTWTESQGEPGDAEPFCPSDCLETRRSNEEGHP
ncbi:hypothetical protein F5X99DRAFT_406472 [Biscogniauxia marginata]|nr:hypothetical protein F5X99DRAFT_406472 [Biscogniauxia marginata]